jgi:transposase-like protein
MAAAKETESEPLTGAERAELMRLRKQVHELARNNEFLGKASSNFEIARTAPTDGSFSGGVLPLEGH